LIGRRSVDFGARLLIELLDVSDDVSGKIELAVKSVEIQHGFLR
jgi:hypothetical protein